MTKTHLTTAFLAMLMSITAIRADDDPTKTANVIVSPDGSGKYKTILEAVNAAPQLTSHDQPWVIYIKAGTYKELIYVQREKRFIKLVGEDAARTIITFNLFADMKGPDGLKIGTFHTPTVYIDADDF